MNKDTAFNYINYREILYELQVFASVESTISVTGTTVVDFRDVTIDLSEINTVIETASIEVSVFQKTGRQSPN